MNSTELGGTGVDASQRLIHHGRPIGISAARGCGTDRRKPVDEICREVP
jgi:hypothetical protein